MSKFQFGLITLLVAVAWAGLRPGQARAEEARAASITPLKAGDLNDFVDKWTRTSAYPSQFGQAGWPGALDQEISDETSGYRGKWGFPERIPYAGSVEHFRLAYMRYLPVVPLYNTGTLVKNFRATEFPGIDPQRIVDYAEPVYWQSKYGVSYKNARNIPKVQTEAYKTSKYNAPVKVVKWDQSHPAFEFDLGDLKPGTYVLRIIAATETDHVQYSTKRLVINCTINDGLKGEENLYRKRCGALDEFYSMAEFFFTADQQRSYKVKLAVDPSSQMPLLVYNIDLHDRLGMVARQAGKQSTSYFNAGQRQADWDQKGTARKDGRSKEDRWASDLTLWQARPGLNVQPLNAGGAPPWDSLHNSADSLVPAGVVDDGLGIDFYGSDMLWNRDPKDIDEENAAHRMAMVVGKRENLQRQTSYRAAEAVNARVRRGRNEGVQDSRRYHQTGDEIAARTAAIKLLVTGWMNVHGIDAARQTLQAIDVIPSIGWGHGDIAFRQHYREAYTFHSFCAEVAKAYDQVFPYIKGNEDLAASVSRFMPQIKSAADLQRYYETTLLQFPAHLVMAYEDSSGSETGQTLAEIIAVQQDPKICAFWTEWLFRFLWMYPLYPTGMDELMVNAVSRDGTNKKGSLYYSNYGNFLTRALRGLEIYQSSGGSLPRPMPTVEGSPRAMIGPRFASDMMVAGGYSFWIGDVSGPSRPRETNLDPKNKSRVLATWMGVLETNTEDDNFRNRRAAGLRVHWGVGHHHFDQLDFQIWGQGVPLSGDAGGRSGYATPQVARHHVHNTVISPSLCVVNSHSWVSSIADAAGTRYLKAEIKPGVPGLYERQISLIDVPESTNSYTVDVFRVAGAKEAPTYAFHGPPNDDLEHNATNVKSGAPYYSLDPSKSWNGTTPKTLVSTWRMRRYPETLKWVSAEGQPMRVDVPGAEAMAMGKEFSEDEPRKLVRMHLLGHEGDDAFGIRMICIPGNSFTNDIMYVRPHEWDGQTIFPVVYEPFSGERFVQAVKLLTPEAVKKADAPIVFEVTLVGGGRDIIYMARRNQPETVIEGVGTFQGEYAYLSYDRQGLRQATLVGRTFKTGEITITPERPDYTGTMTKIDYKSREAVFSSPLPRSAKSGVIEIGPLARPTSFTLDEVNGAQVRFDKDMEFALYRVRSFLPELGVPVMQDKLPDVIPGMLAVKYGGEAQWRVGPDLVLGDPSELSAALGGYSHPIDLKPWERALNLVEGPKPSDVLKVGDSVYIYEIGVGDPYRLPGHVNVIRGADGKLSASGNVPAYIESKDQQLKVTVEY